MSLINNIQMTPGAGIANIAQSQGVSAGVGGLAGFLNMILTQVGQPAAGQSLLGGNVDTKALTEKIAAALNMDPADPAALLKALQQMNAADLAKISASADTEIKPTLISDLAANIATTAQQSDEAAPADLTQLAALMNQMEPGAEKPLDKGILSQLQAALQQLVDSGKINDPAEIAQFRENAIEFMKNQGLDDAAIKKYLKDIATSLDGQTAALISPMTAAAESDPSLPLATGQQAEETASDAASAAPPRAKPTILPEQQTEAGARGSTLPKPAEQSVVKTDATPDKSPADLKTPTPKISPAPDVAAPAVRNDNNNSANATPSKPAAPATSSLALVNAMAQDGADTNGDSTGYSLYKNDSSLLGASYIKADASNPQSFVNYMTNAAQNTSTQMTQMVALQIQKNMAAQVNTFTMQLEPAELGRLDIQMKFGKDGSMKAHLTADRPETLAMLQRDQQQLGRILQQAGIDTDESSLSFDLRQQGNQDAYERAQDHNGRRGVKGASAFGVGNNDLSIQAKIAVASAGYISQSGVNIMV